MRIFDYLIAGYALLTCINIGCALAMVDHLEALAPEKQILPLTGRTLRPVDRGVVDIASLDGSIQLAVAEVIELEVAGANLTPESPWDKQDASILLSVDEYDD